MDTLRNIVLMMVVTSVTAGTVYGGDLIGFYNIDNGQKEAHISAPITEGKLGSDIWLEVNNGEIYAELGMGYKLAGDSLNNFLAVSEYTSIPGEANHKRVGVMGKVDLGIVDLMARLMYDTEQDIHFRIKLKTDLPFGTLTYLLANLKANGENHQRITYQTPDNLFGVDGLAATTQLRFTSGDCKGPTPLVGIQYSK